MTSKFSNTLLSLSYLSWDQPHQCNSHVGIMFLLVYIRVAKVVEFQEILLTQSRNILLGKFHTNLSTIKLLLGPKSLKNQSYFSILFAEFLSLEDFQIKLILKQYWRRIYNHWAGRVSRNSTTLVTLAYIAIVCNLVSWA